MPTFFGSNTAEALFNLDAKDTEQDGRLDAVEADNVTQDGRLDVLEGLPPARVVHPYVSGQSVLEGSLVVDDGWLMYALADTGDPAAPAPVGDPYWGYAGTLIDETESARQLIYGGRYTFPTAGYATGYRIYTTVGQHYEVYSITDPLGVGDIQSILNFTGDVDGWDEFSISPVIFQAGAVFDLVVVQDKPADSPVTFTGNWDYTTPNNATVPIAGQITHSTKALAEFRIHTTDDDAGDRGTELRALVVGDRIQGGGGSWTIQAITDNTTWLNFEVQPASQGAITGVGSFEFETVPVLPVPYGREIDGHLANANVDGLFIADGRYADIVPDDNAYGVDIQIQQMVASDDWLPLSAPSGSTGVGSGGGGDGGGTTYLKDREELGNQAANVDWNWANGAYGFTVTLTGNALVAEPANPPAPVNGQYVDGILTLIQDATGSWQPTWDSVWRNTPTLIAAADSSAAIPFHFDGVDYVLGAPVEYVQSAPPPPGDAFWASVSLLLSFDGTDGDTTFPDTSSMSPTVTRVAPAELDNAQQKFGATSLQCLGSGGHADCTVNAIGTGDFTAECWVRLSTLNSYNAFFTIGTGTTTAVLIVFVNASGEVKFYNGSEYNMGANVVMSVDTWHHLCLQREGDEFRIFIDGEHCGLPKTLTSRNFTTQIRIGGPTVIGHSAFNGHLDEFRFTEGVVRYPGWFVPRTLAFATVSGDPETGERGFGGSTVNKTMASASSQYSESYTPAEGFDGVSSDSTGANSWLSLASDLTPWYQISFGAAKKISAVRLKPRQSADRNSPNACTLRVGSDASFASSDQDTPITFPEPALGEWTPWQIIGTPVSAPELRLEIDTRHIVGTQAFTTIQEIEFKEIV